MFWSHLSDQIGRKPVLLAGMVGLFVTIMSAGLSKSYIAFALSRCIQGAFNGNVGEYVVYNRVIVRVLIWAMFRLGVAKNVMVEVNVPPLWYTI